MRGALYTPEFGDARADGLARAAFERLYPDRRIVTLNLDRIYENGGGGHCVTQQEPAGQATSGEQILQSVPGIAQHAGPSSFRLTQLLFVKWIALAKQHRAARGSEFTSFAEGADGCANQASPRERRFGFNQHPGACLR